MTITRFAPSPTGYIHIGGVRAALYPYLTARQSGADGKFLLRIEDTDQGREVAGASDLIMSTLELLGLKWDGDPVFQTTRKEIYHRYAQKLIDSGRAYADPTPSEIIAKYREEDQQAQKPFLYRNHRPTNTPEWQPGLPLRFRSEPKAYTYHDEVMGDLTMGPETQDDIILIKADGLPTYNFAHIVDDAEMGITHVMRGVEYLPSMGNYLALYDALRLDRPIFVHMPHILGPSGTKKLSKRDGAKSVTDYLDDGILPETLVNSLAMLGWNDGSEQEIYSLSDLVKSFRLDHIQKSPARFDEQKLLWYSGQWIRRLYEQDPAAFYARTKDYWPETAINFKDDEKQAVLAIIYDRLKTLSDLRTFTSYFFADPDVNLDLVMDNKFLKTFSESELITILQQSQSALEATDWTAENIQTTLNQLLETTAKKPAELFSLLRLSLSYAPFTPDLAATMHVLTKPTTLSRLSALASALSAD